MSLATRSMNNPVILETHEPLAARIARSIAALSAEDLPAEVTDKVKLCLIDLIGCAFESRDLPWSRQAVVLAPSAMALVACSMLSPSSREPAAAAATGPVMPVGRWIFATSASITARPTCPPTS